MKKILLPILEDKFVLKDLHVQATLLDPIMKSKLGGFGVDSIQIAMCKTE
jgi:hypothetical protein